MIIRLREPIHHLWYHLVGATGFEPATFRLRAEFGCPVNTGTATHHNTDHTSCRVLTTFTWAHSSRSMIFALGARSRGQGNGKDGNEELFALLRGPDNHDHKDQAYVGCCGTRILLQKLRFFLVLLCLPDQGRTKLLDENDRTEHVTKNINPNPVHTAPSTHQAKLTPYLESHPARHIPLCHAPPPSNLWTRVSSGAFSLTGFKLHKTR